MRGVNFIFTMVCILAISSLFMALRKEKLETFRGLLFSRREELAATLRDATADFINDDSVFADSIDQAAADADRSLLAQMKNRDHGILVQIDEALRRIDSGSFGECEQCGEAIAEGRIKAFPFTTLCIDCKSELESESQRYPGRA
jgi:DnaK suppressor protein